MSKLQEQIYSFDEDGMLRLQKDLNYMFNHLDDSNVRRLYTENCNIQSEDGETTIDGPLLVMTGDPGTTNSTTIRLKAGWDDGTSEFVFNLYDTLGNPTIEIDSTGDAVFRGSVNTAKDVYIGQKLIINWDGSTTPPPDLSARAETGMFIRRLGTTEYVASVYSSGVSTDADFEVLWISSAAKRLQCRNYYLAFMLADITTDLTWNSTDYISLHALNNRCYLNTDNIYAGIGSTHEGTIIGKSNSYDTFLGIESGRLWDYKVPMARDMPMSFKDHIRYWYSHNFKFIDSPTTDYIGLESTNISIITGSTRGLLSDNPTNIIPKTSGSKFIYFNGTIPSLDLTVFPDGTAMTSDDYLVVLAYLTDITYTLRINIGLGNSTADEYDYPFTSALSTGWNLLKKPLGGYDSVIGSPSFNNITNIQVGARLSTVGRPSTVGGHTIDYLAVVRAAPDNATSSNYSAFQRNINSTHENELESYYNNIVAPVPNLTGGEDAAIAQIPIEGTYLEDTYLRKVQDFDVRVTAVTYRSNEGPAIHVNLDADNYITLSLSSGVLRLAGLKAGSTFGDYINCSAFSQYADIEIGLKRRQGQMFRGWFHEIGSPENYREISNYNGPSTYLDFMNLYLGTVRVGTGVKITNIEINPYNDLTENEYL